MLVKDDKSASANPLITSPGRDLTNGAWSLLLSK